MSRFASLRFRGRLWFDSKEVATVSRCCPKLACWDACWHTILEIENRANPQIKHADIENRNPNPRDKKPTSWDATRPKSETCRCEWIGHLDASETKRVVGKFITTQHTASGVIVLCMLLLSFVRRVESVHCGLMGRNTHIKLSEFHARLLRNSE